MVAFGWAVVFDGVVAVNPFKLLQMPGKICTLTGVQSVLPTPRSHTLHEAGHLIELDLPITIRIEEGERLRPRTAGPLLVHFLLAAAVWGLRLLREVVVVVPAVMAPAAAMTPPIKLLQSRSKLLLAQALTAVLVLASEEVLRTSAAALAHALHEAGHLIELDLAITIRIEGVERLLGRLFGGRLLSRSLIFSTALLRQVVVVVEAVVVVVLVVGCLVHIRRCARALAAHACDQARDQLTVRLCIAGPLLVHCCWHGNFLSACVMGVHLLRLQRTAQLPQGELTLCVTGQACIVKGCRRLELGIGEFVKFFRKPKLWWGCSVTIPYKRCRCCNYCCRRAQSYHGQVPEEVGTTETEK